MSVKNEFSKHASQYNSYNIIQQIVAKSLVRDIENTPANILELGCGTGQIFKHISWDLNSYTAMDFSSTMCELHPKSDVVEVKCLSFDSDEFFDYLKNKKYDLVISSSALQWSKDLTKIAKSLSEITNEVNAVLFTSNTFKRIQELSNASSPILSQNEIKDAFLGSFECEFEIFNYNLEFDSKKKMFEYIKKSGVSGGKALDFTTAKKLYKEYDLNYLEFEVIFVKAKKL